MYSQRQIDDFIKEKIGINELRESDDLLNDKGVCGDDFHELIDEYSTTFNVDMSCYLWYFHADEEGWNIGGFFFKPPYERVTHISVTPAMLLYCANKGYWDIQYPPHKLPKRRWDIFINQVMVIIFISLIIYSCLK